MATPFSDIIDLSMITLRDWKIDNLYTDNQTNWETYMSGFVVRAIPQYTNCKQSLNYDLTTKEIESDLNNQEKDILATFVIGVWLDSIQNNLTQLVSTMTPSDAKRTNVPQMISQRQNMIDIGREKNSQKMVDYGINNIDWEAWANGNYWG